MEHITIFVESIAILMAVSVNSICYLTYLCVQLQYVVV